MKNKCDHPTLRIVLYDNYKRINYIECEKCGKRDATQLTEFTEERVQEILSRMWYKE